MRKFTLPAIALLALTLFAADLSGGEKRLRVAIVPVNLNNAIFMDSIENASRAGRELGVDIIATGSPDADAEEQIRTVERLISRKFDGILLFPVDSEALREVVDKAVDSGVTVGLLNSDIPGSKRAFCYGTDNYALGRACGQKMVEIMGGTGTVAIQTGIVGMAALDERVRGFRAAIAGSGITEVAFQANDDDTERAVDLINGYLAENRDLDGYFVTGGWPFFAPPEQLPELAEFRRRGGKFGIIDTFYPMFRFMDRPDPLVDFMIGQDYAAMGYNGVDTLVRLLRGGTVEQPVSYSPFEYCDADNLEEVMAGKKPW